jgi:hypothetical protein
LDYRASARQQYQCNRTGLLVRGYAPQTAHILPGLLIWSRVEPYDSPGTYRFQEENDGPSFPTSSTAT